MNSIKHQPGLNMQSSTQSLFLQLHIVAGALSLLCSLIAVTARMANWPHRWHVLSGQVYTYAMWAIFLTVIPLTLIYKHNLFLLVVGIFSAYLATAGWRYAKNRKGTPQLLDWVLVGVMSITAVVMMAYGIWLLTKGVGLGIVMMVFSVIAGLLASQDILSMRQGGLTGKARIARHLTMMLAGTIAVITAALVVQVKFDPAFVVWIAPTLVITPLIAYWRRKVQGDSNGLKV
jgi:hypothetical protein